MKLNKIRAELTTFAATEEAQSHRLFTINATEKLRPESLVRWWDQNVPGEVGQEAVFSHHI